MSPVSWGAGVGERVDREGGGVPLLVPLRGGVWGCKDKTQKIGNGMGKRKPSKIIGKKVLTKISAQNKGEQ